MSKNFNNNNQVLISLRERVKELECLYKISQISVDLEDDELDMIIGEIAKIIPPAWQYPEITCVTIDVDRNIYKAGKYKDTLHSQEVDIVINKIKRGKIVVSYQEDVPQEDEGPFLKEERKLLNSIAVKIADIIERQEQKTEKDILEKKLKHADRLSTIGELTAGIAHELNEPLGTILGFAQLIQKENLPENVEKDLSKIIDSSIHARNVIRKLIAFAKYDEEKEQTLCNLNDIITNDLYFLESRCKNESINLIKILDNQLPEILINKTQIHQVLINLSVNAIQAMPNGGEILLQTKFSDNNVCIIIQDTGIGISDSNIEKIFHPFFSTKESSNNSGLGLSVVYGIVASYGGNIKVESKINIGTRFLIEFPLIQK